MKKSLKVLVVATAVTAATTIGVATMYQAGVKIEELNASMTELQEENKIKNETIEMKQNEIDELNKKVSEISEELESARRDIERYSRVTHYNRYDVTQKSNATNVHLRRALKGTPLENSAESFVEAEELYGVNAFFLIAICAQESGWGTSDRAVYQNNLTGYAVYNSAARGKTFDAWHDSIVGTAELLKKDYLTESGISFNGLSSKDVNKKYCFYEDKITIDFGWHQNIDLIAYDLVEKANNF